MMHSQPSNDRPIHGCDMQQMSPPLANLWEGHRKLYRLLDSPFGTLVPS